MLIPLIGWISETRLCSRAEAKGALLACQDANFLHWYILSPLKPMPL